MLQLHLSDRQFHCLLRFDLYMYLRSYGVYIYIIYISVSILKHCCIILMVVASEAVGLIKLATIANLSNANLEISFQFSIRTSC